MSTVTSPHENAIWEMSPETAKKLLENGGVLVFLHLPVGSEFGIDMETYKSGEKFMGIKMIPPGLHFIHYSAVSKEGLTAPRTGFFHYFAPKEVVIRKWDKSAEDIFEDSSTVEEKELVRSNLQNLDQNLGPFPYHTWRKWVRFTCDISESLLQRFQPLSGKISSVTQLVPQSYPPPPPQEDSGTSQQRTSCSLEEKYLPDMQKVPGTEIRFTEIPKSKYPDGSSAEEITKHNMDSTYTLEQLLQTYSKPEDILAELQMAHVCFLFGHVYDAYEHWKKIVWILCKCDSGLEKYSELYNNFLSIFHFQIQEIPTEFFVDIVGKENFLVDTLRNLFENIKSNEVDQKLKTNAKNFQRHLTSTLKWDFSSVPEDEEPVIVELES